jgi:DNA-binding transcriptional ArsR family regulator
VTAYGDTEGWGAFADPTRRAIIAYLADRPHSVGELAAQLPVSRPAVSQHLKVLKDAGLVIEHQDGTRRIYQLNPARLAALRDQLDSYWRQALNSYADVVSEDTHDTDEPASRPQREDKTMTQTEVTVRRHVVDAAIDRAFAVFTERFGDFKPREHNLLHAPIAETVFESGSVATSSIEPSTAASAGGRASLFMSRPSKSSSVGTSARSGAS